MLDLAQARSLMVEAQVRTNDVTDERIAGAMGTLPRERFVPAAKRHLAYSDACIELSPGRFLLDPRSFSKLAQLADIGPNDAVLHVACATGYGSAVLAALGREIVALDEDDALLEEARYNLRQFGLGRTTVVKGPLTAGQQRAEGFDVIFVDGAVQVLPDAFTTQLREGGRLVAIFRDGPVGKAHFCVRTGGFLSHRVAFDATVPLLPGFQAKPAFVF